jgi:hypothetical protein
MGRTQDEEGGVGLQIWRVDANTLNKQSRKPIRGGPTSSELCVGLTVPHRRKGTVRYEMLRRASDLNGFFRTA